MVRKAKVRLEDLSTVVVPVVSAEVVAAIQAAPTFDVTPFMKELEEIRSLAKTREEAYLLVREIKKVQEARFSAIAQLEAREPGYIGLVQAKEAMENAIREHVVDGITIPAVPPGHEIHRKLGQLRLQLQEYRAIALAVFDRKLAELAVREKELGAWHLVTQDINLREKAKKQEPRSA